MMWTIAGIGGALLFGVLLIPLLGYSGVKFSGVTRKMLGGLCFTLGNLSNNGTALILYGNQYQLVPLRYEKQTSTWQVYIENVEEWVNVEGTFTNILGKRPFGIMYDSHTDKPFAGLEMDTYSLGLQEVSGEYLLIKPRGGLSGFIPSNYMGDYAKDKTIVSIDKLLGRVRSAGGTGQISQAYQAAIQKHSVKNYHQGYMAFMCVACLLLGCAFGWVVMGG
jgi:hypothetical protein